MMLLEFVPVNAVRMHYKNEKAVRRTLNLHPQVFLPMTIYWINNIIREKIPFLISKSGIFSRIKLYIV